MAFIGNTPLWTTDGIQTLSQLREKDEQSLPLPKVRCFNTTTKEINEIQILSVAKSDSPVTTIKTEISGKDLISDWSQLYYVPSNIDDVVVDKLISVAELNSHLKLKHFASNIDQDVLISGFESSSPQIVYELLLDINDENAMCFVDEFLVKMNGTHE